MIDNYDLFEAHERRRTMHRQICSCCKREIMDEYAFRIDDELVCSDCLDSEYKIYIDDEEDEWT